MRAQALSRAVLSTAALLAVVPASAHAAATVDVSGSTLRYTAAAAEVNVPAITFVPGSPGEYVVSETGTTLAPGAGCVADSATRVRCADLGIGSIAVNLGDLNDAGGSVAADIALAVTLLAGPGDDAFTSGAGNDQLTGDIGNDTLGGGAGRDRFPGGTGDDSYSGGSGDDRFAFNSDDPGSDTYTGGPGTDEMSYRNASRAAVATLDDVRNDGIAGEDDVRSDIENLVGSQFSDSLTGSAAGNVIQGNDGSDVINGLGGDDWLLGTDLIGQGSGNDTIAGGDGNDWLTDGGAGVSAVDGGAGDDFLWTGPGADTFTGGPGRDLVDYGSGMYESALDRAGVSVSFNGVADDGYPGEGDNIAADVEDAVGGFGNDRFFGSPGRNFFSGAGGADFFSVRDGDGDVVDCGADVDGVVGDPFDVLLFDSNSLCESADLGAPLAPAPGAAVARNPTPLTARLASTRVRGGVARVSVACGAGAAGPCQGAAVFSLRGRRIGSETFALNPGERETVEVVLSQGARRTLSRTRRLAVVLRVLGSDNGGLGTLVRVRATLRR